MRQYVKRRKKKQNNVKGLPLIAESHNYRNPDVKDSYLKLKKAGGVFPGEHLMQQKDGEENRLSRIRDQSPN